jgi:vacuolar-type H+-ATPase subunit F/Vma7
MRPPVYLGDEASAAGYRLAGARVVVPAAGEEAAALAQARAEAPLVLLGAALAARIPEATLRAARAASGPLLLVVDDLVGGRTAPDLPLRLRAQLGMEQT